MRKTIAYWNALFRQKPFLGYPPVQWVIWAIALITMYITVTTIVADRQFYGW